MKNHVFKLLHVTKEGLYPGGLITGIFYLFTGGWAYNRGAYKRGVYKRQFTVHTQERHNLLHLIS